MSSFYWERKLSSVVQQDQTVVGGVQSLVDILNRVGSRSAEKVILDGTEEKTGFGRRVKRRMFVFEDLIQLPG